MKLTKGQLVMTEDGIAEYQNELPKNSHSCRLLSTVKLTRAFEVTNLTRSDVEQYIKSLGWVYYTNSYVYEKEDNRFEVAEFDTGEYRVSGNLDPKDFDTAPAMQAEAILMARLLNATKD